MRSKQFLIGVILGWLSIFAISIAEEMDKEPIQAEAERDLSKEVLGYWVLDFDSAETKALIDDLSEVADTADLQKEMEATTFEFKPEQMVLHQPNETSLAKITMKSQDLEKRVIVADFQSDDDDEPVPMTLQINGDRLILNGKEPENKEVKIGLKRIDEEAFKKRVSEVDKEEEAAIEPKNADIEFKDGYPVATPVPDKAGFVFSPYNQRVVDVRDIPSGTLVADPNYPSDEKKFFRVP